MMVDVLCAVLSGANWGPFAPPFMLRQQMPERSVGKGIGHFFGALRIDGFIDPDEFKRQIDDLVRTFRATRPAPGTRGPLIPGDPERDAEAQRARDGIPLLAAPSSRTCGSSPDGPAFPSSPSPRSLAAPAPRPCVP